MARILLVVTLVLFGALTSVAVWHHGYRGIFETMFQSWAGVQVLVDLVIALVLVLVWMCRLVTHGPLPEAYCSLGDSKV